MLVTVNYEVTGLGITVGNPLLSSPGSRPHQEEGLWSLTGVRPGTGSSWPLQGPILQRTGVKELATERTCRWA